MRLSLFAGLLAIPLALVSTIPTPHIGLVVMLLCGAIVHSSLRLAYLASLREPRIVAITFWIFVYVFLGITPLAQAVSGSARLASYEPGAVQTAALVVLVGLLSFEVSGLLLRSARGLVIPPFFRRVVQRRSVAFIAIVSPGLAIFLLSQLGGAELILLTRFERDQLLAVENLPTILALTSLSTIPPYVCSVALLSFWMARRRQSAGMGVVWTLLTLSSLVATALLNNPVTAPRLIVGTVLLSLFFVLPWRRWSGMAIAIGLPLALIVVFPYADLYRITANASLGERLADSTLIGELVDKGDFDAFEMIAGGVSVVEREGHQFGRQLVGAMLFWVPRAIWPDKPLATGQWIGEQLGLSFTNLSAPLWVELFVDGSWLLVVIGFAFYSYVVDACDRWHAASQHSNNVQMVNVLVPIYAGYQIFLLRGSLMPAVAYLAPIVLLVLLCTYPSSGRTRVGRPNEVT